MDGASTDKTVEILNEYAVKHKNITVVSEPDKGQWHALDKALALTRGEYLFQLCGQDGYLDNDGLNCVSKPLRNTRTFPLCGGFLLI